MPNRLAQEPSPYLLQHANNPVDWFPWGAEAFTRAQEQDRPIFLSIGYSTCHWCHVMEHESFESDEIAQVLNTHFVPIKVDREERPDIDRVYMAFVQATTGSGGWVWRAGAASGRSLCRGPTSTTAATAGSTSRSSRRTRASPKHFNIITARPYACECRRRTTPIVVIRLGGCPHNHRHQSFSRSGSRACRRRHRPSNRSRESGCWGS